MRQDMYVSLYKNTYISPDIISVLIDYFYLIKHKAHCLIASGLAKIGQGYTSCYIFCSIKGEATHHEDIWGCGGRASCILTLALNGG
jgi:hypothetical protein